MKINYLRLVQLKLFFELFNKDRSFSYFFEKIRLFDRSELKRRVLRKYYLSLFSGTHKNSNTCINLELKSRVLKNYQSVLGMRFGGFRLIRDFVSRDSLSSTKKYTDILSSRVRFLRRFGSLASKLKATDTLF